MIGQKCQWAVGYSKSGAPLTGLQASAWLPAGMSSVVDSKKGLGHASAQFNFEGPNFGYQQVLFIDPSSLTVNVQVFDKTQKEVSNVNLDQVLNLNVDDLAGVTLTFAYWQDNELVLQIRSAEGLLAQEIHTQLPGSLVDTWGIRSAYLAFCGYGDSSTATFRSAFAANIKLQCQQQDLAVDSFPYEANVPILGTQEASNIYQLPQAVVGGQAAIACAVGSWV